MNDECHTPNELFDKLDAVFHFRLDAAANKKNSKCEKYLSRKDDALTCAWDTPGWVWLNPPFSKEAGGTLTWIERAYGQVETSACEGVVCLIICDVSTAARDFAWDNAYEIVELSPRINFPSPGKNENRKGGFQAYQLVIFKRSNKKVMSRWYWKDEPFSHRKFRSKL